MRRQMFAQSSVEKDFHSITGSNPGSRRSCFRRHRSGLLTIYTGLVVSPNLPMNENILIVAYESIQTRSLLQGLRGIGLPAQLLSDARSMMAFLKGRSPAVVVLDKAIPEMSGLDLCRIIKSEGRTKSSFILVLLDDMNDQLDAFELGAADCVMKPFNVRKLVLQIRNLLRSIGDPVKSEELKVGDLSLDRARHEVRAANSVISCTPKEFILLGLLMERSGRVQTREQLLNDVWDVNSEIGPRAIDRHVCFLRAKLGPLGRYIKTVPSAGYRLVAQDEIAA
jgi:two-component system, OmpR family, phosphate regulon response regulator PhoB